MASWLKLCTDHPTSLVFLSFLIKFHWGKGIEWTAFYNGFDTPSHVCMYSSQKQNIIFPEMKSETSLSHSPLFLGCEHFLLQHTKTIYNTIGSISTKSLSCTRHEIQSEQWVSAGNESKSNFLLRCLDSDNEGTSLIFLVIIWLCLTRTGNY